MISLLRAIGNRGCLLLICGVAQLIQAQPSGNDISSAIGISVGQSVPLTGDRVTRPHVVYSISLPAGQLFSLTVTRLGPWTSMGFDTVARVSLYAPGVQTVQIFNPSLASAEVGDYAGTGLLNSYMAVAGLYYLDVQFFTSGVSLQFTSSVQSFHTIQASGNDIASAVPLGIGQQLFVIGDRITKPHAVYSVTLPSNQFSMTISRRGPWVSMGYDTVARVSLYAPSTQTVQIFNPSLASAEVGDYATTAVLNYRVAVGGTYFLDFQFFNSGISMQADWISPAPPTAITSINVASGGTSSAQNTWIEIKGTGLAPPDLASTGLTWGSAPEFAAGRMPTQLRGVSVTINGKPGYIYYVRPSQVNALTPLDGSLGPVQVVLTNGSSSSGPFTVTLNTVAPAFLLSGSSKYIAATHPNGTLLGPASMSVPGYAFSPARPGETVVLYGTGFGLPSRSLVAGSSSQGGSLPVFPAIQIGGITAQVAFAGVVSPGLYQFNVVVPSSVSTGDSGVVALYGGVATPTGALISVQQ